MIVKPKQRTHIDFSEHVLTVRESDICTIHTFKVPESSIYKVVFINAGGVMTVTGDLGNWVFCRGFMPSAKSDYVSEGYWVEKLKINSTQKPSNFSSDLTEEAIKEMLSEEEGYYNEKTIEFLKNALNHLDSEFEYSAFLFENNCMEDPPYYKELDYLLLGVFDAYDEIVYRYKTEENEKRSN
jgi:hypothetical protein